ncbi:HAD family hydrolase [Desulfopila sp. IMCC35008]|uniref:HAD family hydrolase n=1 Tax=Desulfopila sp. IMCC35008 TaxID=2653858 RepID=UPI0013D78D63|nr:HAD family hydrolase [Desulfopila sp. IMCC35008]
MNRTITGLFVTDLDGTLLTDKRDILKQEMDNLERLRQLNIGVAIATGRSLFSFNRLLEGDDSLKAGVLRGVDYVIFSTGAGLLDLGTDEILQSHSLSVDDVLNISEYLEGLGVDYMVHAPIPETRKFVYRSQGKNNPDFSRRIELYSEFGESVDKVRRSRVKGFGGATEVLCIASRERGHELAQKIAAELEEFSVIMATSPLDKQSVWIEIFHSLVSKSASVEWLASSLGLTQEYVCGVGNDYNDQDMLQWSAHSFIVENGPSSMKDDYVTVSSNNDGGVSEAISRWLEDGTFLCSE